MRLDAFKIAFGTSGARGLVSDLTDEYCQTFTRSFLSIAKDHPRGLLVAHDLRPSSPRIAASCIAAATSDGIPCHYAGTVPTPALALAAHHLRLPAIMITGSHIPADRNGLKAYRPDGEITKVDEQRMLAADVAAPQLLKSATLPNPEPHVLTNYVNRYADGFAPDELAGLTIGVYEHSSVARDVLHDVLRRLGATTIALGRSETFVPVDTEAIRPADHQLARDWASRHQLDAIVSTDGDADRPLVADENGNWLRGDLLGLLCAIGVKAASVVTPLTSSSAVERSGFISTIIRTRIGSPYVIEAMSQVSHRPPVVGYEANGGFFLGSEAKLPGGGTLAPLPTRDALLPIIMTLSMARSRGLSVSQLQASLPSRFTNSTVLTGVPTASSTALLKRLENDPELARQTMAPDSGAIVSTSTLDGLRLTFETGDIVHLRPSGNAPELRCYAESDSEETTGSLCRNCLGRIKDQGLLTE